MTDAPKGKKRYGYSPPPDDFDPSVPFTNQRWEAFVQGLVEGLTGDEAYRRAGYKPNTDNAARLKSNERIKGRLAYLLGRGAERAEVSAEKVLREMARLAFSDPRALFTERGALRSIHELDDDAAAAVASVEVVTRQLPRAKGEEAEVEYVHKIKMWDKNSALDKIARHLGMLDAKLNLGIKEDDPLAALVKAIATGGRRDEQALMPQEQPQERE